MKTFAISIPKPCHEDWNKMTPDAKGAFCGSCQKSVYDFSKKSDEEIIAVFEKEEKGKVCGRFTPAQLSRPVVTFGNPNTTSRLAIFAYALLLVFGAALFNGADAYGQEVKGEPQMEIMGKMMAQPVKPVVEVAKDTIIPVEKRKVVRCGLNSRENVVMPLGQAMVIDTPPPTIVEEQVYEKMGEVSVEPIVKEPELIRMGDTMYTPITIGIDTTAVEELTNIIEPIELLEPQWTEMVAGGVSYIETTIEPIQIVETTVDTVESVNTVITETIVEAEEETTEDKLQIVAETIILPPTELEVKVSPNPSSGQITLSYNLENTMPVRIELFDITGKMVRTLSNHGKQYAGKYNVSYNISDLPNGIYMATLSTDENKVSAKIILTK